MRTWSYGGNDLYSKGSVHCETVPWWILLIEWFGEWIDWFWLYKIKLPNWPRRKWRYCDDGERFTPREYWGTVGDMVFAYVSSPIIHWAIMHPKREEVSVELGWTLLRETFYEHDPDFFDDMEGLHDYE
jgi:hypothetical protein